MKQTYIVKRFNSRSEDLIATMNGIIGEYQDAGYVLTVRQLYYQLVARGVIPNTERSYKNTTNLVNDARLAGLMDWDAIEDRTRSFIRRPHWDSGRDFLDSVVPQFHMDLWKGQEKRVFVIIEKEALTGVLQSVCRRYDVPLLAARGYPSSSVLREFVLRDIINREEHREIDEHVIIHLGDHDPSGIDMTRDLHERINLFANEDGYGARLNRIALTLDQVQEQKPPPNPAKTTDARFADYQRQYGNQSWELDALKPDYLSKLVEKHIKANINKRTWENRVIEIASVAVKLAKVRDKFKE